jgi:uncharacterized protein (TIGR01244 family)
MNTLNHIRNFLRIDDGLATSGMPQPDDFAALRQAGFEVVVNLAMPTSDNALPNEGELVSAQGMTYVHIPVKFDTPQPADFEQFSRVLDACAGQRVFVHCAANKRVSAFVFLHRLRLGADRATAERDLKTVWQPDPVWREFVNERLAEMKRSPLCSDFTRTFRAGGERDHSANAGHPENLPRREAE